jgi:hypothetical protein
MGAPGAFTQSCSKMWGMNIQSLILKPCDANGMALTCENQVFLQPR